MTVRQTRPSPRGGSGLMRRINAARLWLLTVCVIGLMIVPRPGSAAPATMSAAPAQPADALLVQRPSPVPSWLDTQSSVGRITIHAPEHLSAVARRLAKSAEGTLTRIAADLEDLRRPEAIEVRLVDDVTELQQVAPSGRGAPSYAVGVAYPDLGVISIAMRRGAEPVDVEATLRHELAHIALGVALGPDVPRWLHEGFAYQHSAEWSWQRTEALAGMVWFHSIIPLDQLDQSFPAEEMAAHRAYAESYDFVGYLSRRGRWEDLSDDGDRYPFRRFLASLAAGESMNAAAIRAFGRPINDLFDEWRDDISNRLMFAPVGLFALSIWLLAAVLLVMGWMRRRRQARATLARWADEEQQRRQDAMSRHWSGANPLGTLGVDRLHVSEDRTGNSDLPSAADLDTDDVRAVDRNEDSGPLSSDSGASGSDDERKPPRYWN